MAGLSDVPFRTLAWRMGAGYMVSEMLSSKPELWETGKSRLRRVPVPGVLPVAVQIAGTDPNVMAEAAKRHVDDGVEVIDINFGCPAKKVCRKSAGSALLADLDLIGRIVAEVVRVSSVPVTVKTRVGLVPGDGLGIEAGRIAAASGAQMVVMHGRSRACKFNGSADYSAVRQLKDLLDVPVMVNGDIDTVAQARTALAASGADGVMIGRGAIGQPWIFAALTGAAMPDVAERWRLIEEHVRMMHEFYGAETGVRIARKHVIAYMQRLNCEALTPSFLKLTETDQQLQWLARHASDQTAKARYAA
jgi:tRNA-dihydrouridine synthase B